MNSIIDGMLEFDFKASPEKSKKSFSVIENRHAITRKYAWHGVSRAFAKTGSNMWQAVRLIDKNKSSSPEKIYIIARGTKAVNFLKGVSFKRMPNRKIRIIARDAKTVDSLKNVTFELLSKGTLRLVIKEK